MRKVVFWLLVLLTTFVLSVGIVFAQPIPQGSVQIVVNRDNVNVRMSPALGADLAGTVNAGYATVANGRSPDNQWLRIDFQGQEAWIGVPVITVLQGDIAALPVGDPRSIPYGGFESPRSGPSDGSPTGWSTLTPGTMRLEPVDSATEMRAATWTAGMPALSISCASAAPQRVLVPQVEVTMAASTPCSRSASAISRPTRRALATGAEQPGVA